MPYQVIFRPTAEREIRKLPKEIQTRVVRAAEALAQNPLSHKHEKIQGHEDTYRIRVGDYRIVYEVHDSILIVLVLAVGHRGHIYRRF